MSTEKKIMVACLVVSVASLAILIKFAQVGIEAREEAMELKRNPLGALFGLFKPKPAV